MLYYLLIISGVVFIIYIVIKNNITPEWLTSVGTCGAVVVALFKDNISKFWNKVKLEISYPHPLEEDTVKACDETHNIRASRYFTKLQVKNNSKNCCAEKISCWIDKISVKTTVGQYQDLPIIHEEIKLNKDLIYPQRKLDICLFEISMENSFENNETSILPKKI